MLLLTLYSLSIRCYATDTDRRLIDFSGSTAEENKISLMGAGFGQYPQADVSFGAIPTDNSFEGATDGRGVIVQADPGEGVMLLVPVVVDERSAMIRCSIRSTAPHAS